MKRKYSVVFPGARDAYHLPYGLWINNRLSSFLTDLYNKKWINSLPFPAFNNMLNRRQFEADLLPHRFITHFPALPTINYLLNRVYHKAKAAVIMDNLFARLAVNNARKEKSNLLLYEFQAEWAFQQKFQHDIRKLVFYFHPHPSFEHPMLFADCKLYPAFQQETMQNTRSGLADIYKNHTKSAWKNADHIIVASSFTKRSLCEVGAPEEKISVIPYGMVLKETSISDEIENSEPYFLFVGSGSQRKGLHHLLKAWGQSSLLSASGKLIVVSREVDPYNRKLLCETKGVIWKAGVNREALIDLYRNASLFVMPSLSEGFGHVYLEALGFGCPVLGTNNSILADIPEQNEVIYKVEPGNIEQLQDTLQNAWNKQPGLRPNNRKSARLIQKEFSWDSFHNSIEHVLRSFD